MPALESINIMGFKSIRYVDVKLRDINVLIGANGSGKSNFLEIFSLLQVIHEGSLRDQIGGPLRQYVARTGGANRLLHFGSKITEEIEIHVRFQDPTNRYRITLEAADTDTLLIALATANYSVTPSNEFPIEDRFLPHDKEAVVGKPDITQPENEFGKIVSNWRLYHFQDTSRSAPITKTAALHDNRYLRPDGSNLAAFLYLLREKHEDSYRFLRNTVRLVAPFFEDFYS